MVLTQLARKKKQPIENTVSIPLWFLRNQVIDEKNITIFKFPYHYGSYATVREVRAIASTSSFHTTMVLTQRIYQTNPLDHARPVSIPLWFLRNGENMKCKCIGVIDVSIPLWFLRNFDSQGTRIATVRFPYHYGSYATCACVGGATHNRLRFPYHYGSYATLQAVQGYSKASMFPYHYGSYATIGYLNQGDPMYLRFHTTMVLTQLGKSSSD